MAEAYRLVRERSRVRVEPEGGAHLEITYALAERLPAGIRKLLVPRLKEALAKWDHTLLAVDLFDEFVRLHLPLEASPKVVEAALKEACGSALKEAPSARAVPTEAQEQLERYLGESAPR